MAAQGCSMDSIVTGIPLDRETLVHAAEFIQRMENVERGESRVQFSKHDKLQSYAMLKRIINFCQRNEEIIMAIDEENRNTLFGGCQDDERSHQLGPLGQIGNWFMENGRLRAEAAKMKEELVRCKKDAQRSKFEADTYKCAQNALDKRVEETEEQNDMLQTRYENLCKKEGKQMTSQLSSDQTKTENINDKCRPSAAAADYRQLSFVEARNMKDKLLRPDGVPESTWGRLLSHFVCSVFMISHKRMMDVHEETLSQIQNYLTQPACLTSGCRSEPAPSANSTKKLCPEGDGKPRYDRADFINEMRKFTPVNINTKCLVDGIIESSISDMSGVISARLGDNAWRFYNSLSPKEAAPTYVANIKRLREFVCSTCDLTWKLAIQQPPMLLTTPDGGDMYHNITDRFEALPLESEKHNGKLVVDYTLEPSLMHGQQVLVKGRVKLFGKKSSEHVK